MSSTFRRLMKIATLSLQRPPAKPGAAPRTMRVSVWAWVVAKRAETPKRAAPASIWSPAERALIEREGRAA